MTVARIVQIVSLVWVLSEIVLIRYTRRHLRGASPRDRGSRTLLWCAMGAGVAAGSAVQAVTAARIRIPAPWLPSVSLVFIVGGLLVRWTAILTLGRFFSTSVAIQQDHRLIRTGLFRWVRHPSYSGLLLVFLGLAISSGNWLSVPVIMIPFLVALRYRMHVEESSLVEALGQDYVEYCRSTKRLLPRIY